MSSEPTIRVKHLNGEEYPTPISLDDTIGALKEKVEAASGIAAARQRLIYKGKEVHNHVQLAAAGLSDGKVIHLVERLIAPASEGQPAPSVGAQTQGQPGAGVFSGPGLEAVNAIVSQVVGGLLGPTATHGSQPVSPGTPHRRRRTAPALNGLVALHGYLSRLSDLESLDDPPAMLPVVRTGLPDSHHSWDSVTSATTAVLNSNRQRHGSLQAALIAATGDNNLSSATVDQLDALLQRAVTQQQQQPRQDVQHDGAGSSEASRGSGASASATDAAASQAQGAPRADATPSDTYEFTQLVVLAYALTMAQAAESMRTFEANFTERAAALARDVLRDVQDSSATFERSQVHMERLGTTANRMSGLAVETAYLCGLFANAVRGDHRMLADGMNPVVLMTDQQHSRALQHAATIMPQAFPSGQPAAAPAADGSAPRPSSVDAMPRISINPGFAPMLVGSSSLRRIMPTRATTTRASTATTSGGSGSPGGATGAEDPGSSAAWSLLHGILGSTADVSQVVGGLPGEPMPSPLAATMQAGTSSGVSGSAGAAAPDPSSVSAPAHSSEQQVQDLPIFNQDPGTAGASVAPTMPTGMPLAGIHISSSIVTGDLPFRNVARTEGGAAGGAANAAGSGAEARGMDGVPNPDGTTDVGGMIIQLELPQDGGSVTSIQTAGIGQLGSVLQNMMQEQLAFARERIRDLGGNDAGSGGAAGPGAPSGATAAGAPGTSSADPDDAPAGGAETADMAPSSSDAGSTAALSLPTQVLRLTQQLVSDVRRQQALPEEERAGEAARLTRQYLQQVPDMLRQALPQAAAGVDEFMQRGQGPGAPAPAAATASSAPVEEAPAATPAAPDADPVRDPAPPAGPAAAAAPDPTADDAVASGSGAAQDKVSAETLAADFKAAMEQFSAGASTSSAASAGASSSARSSQAGPSLPKRPEPKGLAGGLKPRKPRSAAPAAAGTGATPGSDPAPSSAVVPSIPAPAAAAGGAASGGGGGGALDMLLPLMQSPQMQGMAQQMMQSPQMQGMAEQMSSGETDLGSLMQSMMPMVSSMFGGAPPGQDQAGSSAVAGRGTRSAGAGSSQANSMPAAGSAEMKAILVQQLGAEEAARWQKVLKEDKGAMQRAGKSGRECSSAYAAGSTRDAEGDKGFMF